ncbi:MAG TPA: phytoene/squalene synthase family protein [Chthonomonadales bacterium]|nr:phytoene/squalene synthase family protein [Chthonomonadales bacterium]
MDSNLERSYQYCQHIARTQARNFYYSFTILPPEKKAAMCAVYAFMRYCDDLSDVESHTQSKQEQLTRWRMALDQAFEGEYSNSLILPAFHHVVHRYRIPKRFFHALIDGVEMDLTRTRYETFEELYSYCYRVASVVGLVCIHVWGFKDGEVAFIPAEACGIAFQLTNILRDVKEDAERGRIYLPLEDLRRFDYTEEDLLHGVRDRRFLDLMRFETARALEYYEKALPLIPLLDPDSRPAFLVMYRIYRGLLGEIEASGYDVFSQRARVPTWRKVGIVAQAWLGSRVPGAQGLLRV